MINASIACSRLFVNDTGTDDEAIEEIVGRENLRGKIAIVSSRTLGENIASEIVRETVQRSDWLILPGEGSRIAISNIPIVGDFPGKILRVGVSRKLKEGTLKPIGVNISPADREALENVGGSVIVCDDVIASGTTVMGVVEAMRKEAIGDISLIALVCRERNGLGKGLRERVIAGMTVRSSNPSEYCSINTLSSLAPDSPKRAPVMDLLKAKYSRRFAEILVETLDHSNNS